jgi:hypothetical protein
MKNQILSLTIDINTNEKQSIPEDRNASIFTHIFNTFNNLQYLNFGPSLISHQRLSFCTPPPPVISTNLLDLHVCLNNFRDCLYLLDGRFNQLHTLYVNTSYIGSWNVSINNKVGYS